MSALSAAASKEDGDTIKNLQARVADLEAQLYAVGAGGVGKMEQPQVEQKTVGEAGPMPGTDGFTMACFRASDVPVGTKLYTHPQPKREPLTDGQINDHRLALPYDGEDLPAPWDFKQGVKAAERAHGIGGEA